MSKQASKLLNEIWQEFKYAHTPIDHTNIPIEYASFFKEEKQYFLHLTNEDGYKSIKKSKRLMPSGGCLVGSLYCTPLIKEADCFRLHNLGAYLYAKELPNASEGKTPQGFIIELNITDKRLKPIGINYLKLGKLHNILYEKYNALLSDSERSDISNKATREHNDFLEFWKHYGESENELFFKNFQKVVVHSCILGYLYFESIYNFLTEFQTTEISNFYKSEYNEIYNWHAKDLMFELHPGFATHFSLRDFKSPIEKIYEQIKRDNYVKDLDKDQFYTAIRMKLKEYILAFLIREKDYDHLKGHILHRTFRTMARNSDFYLYFDVIKAIEVWNYWCDQKSILPFNSICNKGEVGINPAFMNDHNVEYKIYEAIIEKKGNDNGLYYASHNGTNLQLKISTRMVDATNSFRRANQYPVKRGKLFN